MSLLIVVAVLAVVAWSWAFAAVYISRRALRAERRRLAQLQEAARRCDRKRAGL